MGTLAGCLMIILLTQTGCIVLASSFIGVEERFELAENGGEALQYLLIVCGVLLQQTDSVSGVGLGLRVLVVHTVAAGA